MTTPLTTPLHVCSFESRMSEEMMRLVQRQGAIATNAPSLREIPLSDNTAPFEFADLLLRGEIPIVIFLTGVGTTALFATLETKGLVEPVQAALQRCLVVVRGPKPASALSKLKIRVDLKAPEPNTWEDIVSELIRNRVGLDGKCVAVQEYGAPGTSLYEWLQAQGAQVLPVPVYRWALPEEIQPLQQAIRATSAGEFDVLLWTSAQQVIHVLEVADAMGLRSEWLAAANRCVNGSIGPTTSERLREQGLIPDLEPSHPKMAHLIRETLAQAPRILSEK